MKRKLFIFKRGNAGQIDPQLYPGIITMEPVLIVGAGIVGLTLGQALQKVLNILRISCSQCQQ